MRAVRRKHDFLRIVVVYALIGHLLLITAAAASPALHEWMHPDADCADHDCAITLYVSGACHETPLPVLTLVPQLIALLEEPATARLAFASSFRCNGILEHAPPASTQKTVK